MYLNLDKIDLISLVKGSEPSFSVMEHRDIHNKGYFNDYRGRWEWNDSNLNGCTEEELLNVYIICKVSWKN